MGAVMEYSFNCDAAERDAREGLLKICDVAESLDCSVRTVRRMVDRGVLKSRRHEGGHRMVYAWSVRKYIGHDFILLGRYERVLRRLGKLPE